ncbi:MAG: SDR family oxidoreductase [Actinomycetia bacterium]|nr:SDR family oxidoreductase [Actinomycetes bacterium]
MSRGWLVLTGATSALGRAVAERWTTAGHGPVLGLSRRPERLPPAVREGLAVDLRRPPEAAERLGAWARAQSDPVAGLVHAAGVVYADRADRTTWDEWEQTFTVNLGAALWLARVLLPHFAPGASVVLVSSCDAWASPRPGPDAAYGASKAGVEALTRHLAVEWGPAGVRVNCVRPGPMPGGMGVADADAWTAATVLRGLVEPAEVADVVLFLLSADSRGMTGQCLAVDRGFGLAYGPAGGGDPAVGYNGTN